MMIMVIDDDSECLDSFRMALTLHGYQVDDYLTPVKAIKNYDPQSVKIVITDYHLPGLNGFEVIKKILIKDPNADVIVISGDNNPGLSSRSLELGAYAYFQKPLNFCEIIETIDQIFNGG